MPSGSNYQINDVWFDTDDGNKIYFWKGLPTGWQPQGLGTSAFSNDSITFEKLSNIVNGVIDSKIDTNYISSRGTDLVTNGSGILGTNYNFPGTTFNSVDAPIGAGSFDTPNGVTSWINTTELIPIDLSKSYVLQLQAKQRGSSNTAIAYAGLNPFDIDGLQITPQQYMFQANTTTTLANTIVPGATTINLASSANWNNSAGTSTWLRGIIFLELY